MKHYYYKSFSQWDKMIAFKASFYLSVCLLLLISSCNSFTEETEPAVTTASKNINVDDARSWFESDISPKITASNPHFRISTDLEKEPDWDLAETLDLEDGEVLTVPLKNKDKKRISKGKSEKLVFSQDAAGDMELQVVKAIGDSLHMQQEGFRIGAGNFTGIALLEDWEGNLIEGTYYRNGGMAGRLGSDPNVGGPVKGREHLSYQVKWVAVDWWQTMYVNGSPVGGDTYLDTTYHPVWVEVDDDLSDLYGTYYYEGGTGGGGGSPGGGGGSSDCPYGPNCPNPPLDYGDYLVDMEVVRPLTNAELRAIIFDATFESDPNAPCIWDKLKQNEYFKQITDQFEGVNSEFHINLSIGSTDNPNANAQTQFKGNTNPMEIIFNQDKMGRSALEVARTILHEILHAEFYRSLNTTVPLDTDVKFKNTFENYTALHTGSGAQHHNLMADKYVNAMADVLQDIHPSLGYGAFSDYYNYPAGYPNGIPREFYEALAWDGLRLADVKGWINKSAQEKADIESHIFKASMGSKLCD